MLTSLGMGNRFLEMAGYHTLILAHGIIAAIIFLGFVPAAILINRFYSRSPFWARRIHIWLQIITFLLATVVIVLGFFAVGPDRSLTNPHHGIGVAIYVLIFVQVISGWWMHRRERGRRHTHMPLKVMLHQWGGRAIALLGIVQVALGLTLYGSPESLFILYTLWCFALLLLYFILSFRHQREIRDYDSRGSYLTESEVVEEEGRRRTGLGGLAAAGAAGAGLAALWNRRRSRSRPRTDLGPESDDSYVSDEKDSYTARPSFGRRVLEMGAIGGGIAAARSLFKRRQRKEGDEASYSRPPLGGNQSMTDGSYSTVDEGRPVTPGRHPLANPPLTPQHRRSQSSLAHDHDSFLSDSPSRRDQHTFRDTLATAGGIAAVRQLFKSRRQRKEDRRAAEMRQHEIDQERIQRANSSGQGQFTGDGIIPRRHRPEPSQTASSYSSFDDRQDGHSGILPAAGAGAGAGTAAALHDRDRIRPVGSEPVVAGSSDIPITNVPPAAPPSHGPATSHADSSGSEMYTQGSGQQSHRHRDEAAAALGGAALGATAVTAAESSRRRRSGRYTAEGESPQASLRVKMHNDGRHVTLRQLTEEERRRARRERGASRRRRNSSFSSASGAEGSAIAGTDNRWRRTEEMNKPPGQGYVASGALPPETIAGPSTHIPPNYTYPPPPSAGPPPASVPTGPRPQPGTTAVVPPPPPIPESAAPYPQGASSVTSPGETSDATASYANNRRRRRAERAQARLAREGRAVGDGSGAGSTSRVEFT